MGFESGETGVMGSMIGVSSQLGRPVMFPSEMGQKMQRRIMSRKLFVAWTWEGRDLTRHWRWASM